MVAEFRLILDLEACRDDARQATGWEPNKRDWFMCDTCGTKFLADAPHIHGRVIREEGYMQGYCSEGCAIKAMVGHE